MESLDRYTGQPTCPQCGVLVELKPTGFWKCPHCYQLLTDSQIERWKFPGAGNV